MLNCLILLGFFLIVVLFAMERYLTRPKAKPTYIGEPSYIPASNEDGCMEKL